MTTENDLPELRRFYGLLVSEWITYTMIVIAVAALFFGFKVGGERDGQVERAMAMLDALAEEAERIVASGGVLICDDRLLDTETRANDYLTLSIRPAPIDEDDESLGFGPALYVDVVKEEVSGDTWDTAHRLMARVKEEASEKADKDASRGIDAGAGADGDTEKGDEKEKSRLRKVREPGYQVKEEFLSYYILASEDALCSQDA